MAKVETVAVKHPTNQGEQMIINASDFDASKHTKVGAPIVEQYSKKNKDKSFK
tara:strand:- start:262 stop:420 length:159 start_codon:yes stop_codon:yes gene_type:complete